MNVIQINDLKAEELAVFNSTSEVGLLRYNEPEPGLFVAESPDVVMRAVEGGYVPLSILSEAERLEKQVIPVLELIRKLHGDAVADKIPVYTADKELLQDLTGYALVRGLWAVFPRRKQETLAEFCKGKRRLAILFDIVNPTNVGAIIRSAAALGVDGVILTYDSVNPLYRRASRVSMGTVFQIPWTMANRAESEGTKLIDFLTDTGFATAAMALSDESVSVRDERVKQSEKLAIVLGTEGFGLPKEVIAACTYTIKIPMFHGVDSLNVAAASAISFWELV